MTLPLAMYWSKGVWLKEYLTGKPLEIIRLIS